MDKGITFFLCVIYVALLQVTMTNADWRGNVCITNRLTYWWKTECASYFLWMCTAQKTRIMSNYSYYPSCCPGWNHNGDQNCIIPICSPVCQHGSTCVAPYTCECTQGQTERYEDCTMDGPDSITFTPDKGTIHEFGSLNITCLANCYKFCSFQWIKHGNLDTEEKVVADLATMELPNATRKDAGNYSCSAMNNVTNKTVMDSVTVDVIYHDDLEPINSTDITDEVSPLSDKILISVLIIVLAGTTLILACLICGLLVFVSQKRSPRIIKFSDKLRARRSVQLLKESKKASQISYKQNSNIRTPAEVGPSNVDLANTMVIDTDTDPSTNNFTIENDSTEG